MRTMTDIYINPAHSPSSPGGCIWGRREYDDCSELAEKITEALRSISPLRRVSIIPDGFSEKELSPDALLLTLHRGVPSAGEWQRGAAVTVDADACAQVQYEAYRLLESITGAGGFRYRGVHTLTEKSPFRRFGGLALRRKYLLSTGAIDSPEDNEIFDMKKNALARQLAAVINEICKEAENEDNTRI